ncbi:hypothetical protein B0T10DRAFT_608608 [Thelonectria olida]|uniref:Uncharacterized protein n=1 Tax=Thelonectria olida TaxID=1576542 RepID=A0A9P8VZH7_9HYPO|nr:hypothetical protein B0T10DRAFT_608608 [Thelonectria olida]
MNPALQAMLNDTKARYIKAAEQARNAKKRAEGAYEGDPMNGGNFQQWVVMNYPQLSATYNAYQSAEAAYNAALAQADPNAATAWQQEAGQERSEKSHSSDEFEKSFIIITPKA